MTHRVFRNLNTYVLVTLITALIWIYAEGQDVRDDTRPVTVELPARVGQDLVVELAETRRAGDRTAQVGLTLRGASAQLAAVDQRLNRRVRLPIEPSDLPDQRLATLDLRSLLTRARLGGAGADPGPTIGELGVSVVAVEPGTLPVTIDKLVTRELGVIFEPTGVELGPSVKIEPAEVSVEMPERLFNELSRSPAAMRVEARVNPGQLATVPEGEEQQISARIALPPVLEKPHVTPARETVDVTFTIARQRERLTLERSVPVWLLASPLELKRFEVVLDEDSRVLTGVTIEGPRDLIERLRDPDSDLRVIARIELSGEQMDKGVERASITSIELRQFAEGRSQVLHTVPLNPDALGPDAGDEPTFRSETITVTTSRHEVGFTVTPRPE